jgi:hypothetical protein
MRITRCALLLFAGCLLPMLEVAVGFEPMDSGSATSAPIATVIAWSLLRVVSTACSGITFPFRTS